MPGAGSPQSKPGSNNDGHEPDYKDTFGQPLPRLTFDRQDNDKARYKFLAERCREIMQASESSNPWIQIDAAPPLT